MLRGLMTDKMRWKPLKKTVSAFQTDTVCVCVDLHMTQ